MSWSEAKKAAEEASLEKSARRFAESLLGPDFEKQAALSPLTKLRLGMPVALSAEDEAAFDRNSVRPSNMNEVEPPPAKPPVNAPGIHPVLPESPAAPAAPEEVPEEPTEPMEMPFEPREEPTPVERPVPTLPPPEPETEAPPEKAAPVVVEEEEAEPPTRSEVGKIFSAANIPPLIYREILAAKYKGEWMTWEPETLWWAIRKDFGPITEIVRNKIMAMRICLKTNTPWIDWDAFEHVTNALNDHIPIFGAMQPPEADEAAYTVTILRELGDWPFGAEVAGYIAAVCLSAGLVYAPEEWFPSVQYFIDRQGKHDPALVEKSSKAWEALRHHALTEIEWRDDNPIHNQVKKLWLIRTYIDSKSRPSPMPSASELSTTP